MPLPLTVLDLTDSEKVLLGSALAQVLESKKQIDELPKRLAADGERLRERFVTILTMKGLNPDDWLLAWDDSGSFTISPKDRVIVQGSS